MLRRWDRVIVVGAGLGGLLFARALADWCTQVLVLERDSLSDDCKPRAGVPQGRHLHALLAGGCRAMESMLPGLVADLRAAGAVEVTAGLSARMEAPGYDPFPRRDLGFALYSLSRPLLELCVRRRVQAISNIVIEPATAVERLLHDGKAVTGVALRDGRTLHAELVIDASGRGELTMRALEALGMAPPRQSVIGIDMNYATALFRIPEGVAHDWQSVITVPKAPESSRAVLLSAIEGGRWICGLAWRGRAEAAPTDRESFLQWTRNLRTQTCYHAIKDAEMIGKVLRFAFAESRYRHFTQLETWPRGLLPVADAICRFNPIYGQGMSVAALQAEAFGELLAAQPVAAAAGDLDELVRRFLRRADQIIEAPWNMAALPDFAYPDTRGERPADLQTSLKFGRAFTELAARDAGVHKLMMEVRGLLKPRSAMTDSPALMQRIYDVISEMAQVEAIAAAG
jgi:2-polyprenyl-6-methoxyphenol hydroxylase-like FAD-dependent oxidoreductase